MAKDIKKILSEGVNLPEEVQSELLEAWEAQLAEKTKQLEESLREEYAAKYEHDKQEIVEAMDQFVSSRLTVELEEFSQDKIALAEERIQLKQQTKEQLEKFGEFIKESLNREVYEFRQERKLLESKLAVMEHFVTKKLFEEISEFEQDKRELIAEKVKLIANGKRQILEAKNDFLTNASNSVAKFVQQRLGSEIKQLKEDIDTAKRNDFGRRIFEAFSSEFAVTHLNENKELQKYKSALEESVSEMKTLKESLDAQVEENKRVKKVLAESKVAAKRNAVMSDLLKPLSVQKRMVMESLLENVATERLNDMFKKYLPVVLEGKATTDKSVLSESLVEVTGNRVRQTLPGNTADQEIEELRNLAGINKIKRS
jgi:hypothetical protein